MFYRVLGGVGRTLIAAGLVLLLFVAYQLWGTGLQTARAQDRLETELEEVLAEPPAPDEVGETAAPLDEMPEFEPGQAVGRIEIPAIGSDWIFVQDTDLQWLKLGPGHFTGTRYPGQEGNAAIAGHRTTYGAPFHRLDELVPGDEIRVTTPQGTFTYRVLPQGELAEEMPFDSNPDEAGLGHFIIGPRDSWILHEYGDNRLTLMACHPKYSARQRIVTVGELVEEPAPTPEEPPEVEPVFEEELLAGGDWTKFPPAVLWGMATLAVAATAWYAGRTWRSWRWPAWLLGTPLTLVVLFGCFTFVEQLLPAAY